MPAVPYHEDTDAASDSSDDDTVDQFPEIPSTVGKPGGTDYVQFTPAELKVMKKYIPEFRDGNAKSRAALLTEICLEVYPFQPPLQTNLQWAQRGRVSRPGVFLLFRTHDISIGHQTFFPCPWPQTHRKVLPSVASPVDEAQSPPRSPAG